MAYGEAWSPFRIADMLGAKSVLDVAHCVTWWFRLINVGVLDKELVIAEVA